MSDKNLDYPQNLGITIESIFFGIGIGLVTLIIVIIVEALIMKRHFPSLTVKNRFIYSTGNNIFSIIMGFVIMSIVSFIWRGSFFLGDFLYGVPALIVYPFTVLLYGNYLILAYIFTVGAEFGSMAFWLRPNPPYRRILEFTFKANVVSYLVVFFTPLIIWLFFSAKNIP